MSELDFILPDDTPDYFVSIKSRNLDDLQMKAAMFDQICELSANVIPAMLELDSDLEISKITTLEGKVNAFKITGMFTRMGSVIVSAWHNDYFTNFHQKYGDVFKQMLPAFNGLQQIIVDYHNNKNPDNRINIINIEHDNPTYYTHSE